MIFPTESKKESKKYCYPNIFHKKLKNQIIPDIDDSRFIHSWHGTFISTEFTDDDKNEVLTKLKNLQI